MQFACQGSNKDREYPTTLTPIISGLGEWNGLKYPKQKTISKKFLLAGFYCFCFKNSYPESHCLQGGMKFATQISPPLNYYIIRFMLNDGNSRNL